MRAVVVSEFGVLATVREVYRSRGFDEAGIADPTVYAVKPV